MAHVVALTQDLLFGSRLQGVLSAAGHDVQLASDEAAAAGALGGRAVSSVLLVDLTHDLLEGAAALERLREQGSLAASRTLAYYSHVDIEVRRRAEEAGFDLVVPRSRMAREASELVNQLLEK